MIFTQNILITRSRAVIYFLLVVIFISKWINYFTYRIIQTFTSVNIDSFYKKQVFIKLENNNNISHESF